MEVDETNETYLNLHCTIPLSLAYFPILKNQRKDYPPLLLGNRPLLLLLYTHLFVLPHNYFVSYGISIISKESRLY
jgi:hypothetical protein